MISLIIFLAAACLAYLYWWSQFTIKKSFYEIEGPEDLRIVQISDLHNCNFGQRQSRLLEAINSEKPDVIVFTGDNNFDEHFHNFAILLQQLQDYPMYGCVGNHDDGEFLEDYKYICDKFEVLELDKQTATLDKFVNFSGVSVDAAKKKKNYTIKEGFNILLVHDPYMEKNFKDLGYDLVLSGHMHGGQWRFPGIREGLVSPSKGLFPKFTSGLYQLSDKTIMIVSKGLGTMTFVPRIFNRPELVIVDIKKNNIPKEKEN